MPTNKGAFHIHCGAQDYKFSADQQAFLPLKLTLEGTTQRFDCHPYHLHVTAAAHPWVRIILGCAYEPVSCCKGCEVRLHELLRPVDCRLKVNMQARVGHHNHLYTA
jgi:hypothetical protein